MLMIGGLCAVVAPAFAGFASGMVQSPTNPSGWSGVTQIASLDSSSFDYVDNSGYEAVFSSIVIDRTSVLTNVYRVDTARSVGSGPSINLAVGDLVFAYTVRLVGNFPGLTVNTMMEAQVIGAPDFGFGQDPMAASLINGQGFVVPGHTRTPSTGNIDDADVFGSSVDWEWPSSDVQQLDNGDTITMLMFTSPAGIGQGVVNLIAPPGQSGGIIGVAQGGEAPPVLIPIVPTPGMIFLGTIGLSAMIGPRRRA
jgi:hypothetical protein